MLLQSYQLDVINNHCMPGAQSVNCIARLDQDVGCAIPYLNAVIEGDQFTPDPPSVTFKTEGRLISVTERTITVNAVEDEAQGRKIIEWIKRYWQPFEINEETLALDLIHATGPDGHFLADSHTLKHCRELWTPSLLDRLDFETWSAKGSLTLQERAKQKVLDIIDSHRAEPLPPEVQARLEDIVARR